jgi:hypothetical protein
LDTHLNIAGIEIPSNSPAFLAVLGFHVVAGLLCALSGLAAMLSPKLPGRHPRFGTIYYWCLAVVVFSATILSAMRWKEDYYLFILGLIAFASATFGRSAHRRQWRNWKIVHIPSLGFSYIVLLTAFYVDNGKSLPLWKELPPQTYWLLPASVGFPLIVRALVRYRSAHHVAVKDLR